MSWSDMSQQEILHQINDALNQVAATCDIPVSMLTGERFGNDTILMPMPHWHKWMAINAGVEAIIDWSVAHPNANRRRLKRVRARAERAYLREHRA